MPAFVRSLISLTSAAFLVTGTAAAQLIVGTYYEDTASRVCDIDSGCRLFFHEVKTSKPILITQVSC